MTRLAICVIAAIMGIVAIHTGFSSNWDFTKVVALAFATGIFMGVLLVFEFQGPGGGQ